MVSRVKSSFAREVKKEPRKLFLIAVEGAKTEPEYFKSLDKVYQLNVKCDLIILPPLNDMSAPSHVLKRLNDFIISKPSFNKNQGDQSWLVIDYDEGKKNLYNVIDKARSQHNLAISNYSFDTWLNMHQEQACLDFDANKCEQTRCKICSSKLRQKGYDTLVKGVHFAINYAKNKESTQTKNSKTSLISAPSSRMYKLVEELLKYKKNA